jgi:hypothetical protein
LYPAVTGVVPGGVRKLLRRRPAIHVDAGPTVVSVERLLVVDDEPTVRELLAATLRFAGFAVTSVATTRSPG